MIRNEVDMIRKLVVARAEGAITVEDLRGDAELWSRPELKGYATVFNLGSADVSGVTEDDVQVYVDLLPPDINLSANAIVVNTDEQRQGVETFVQLVEQAGFAAENWRMFDHERDAVDWVVENHPGES